MDKMQAASEYERPEKPTTSHKPSCTEEVRQVEEEYANHLRRVPIMSREECLERAEHYRKAKETAKGTYTRYSLEAMERSYRILAESETQPRNSAKGRLGMKLNPTYE